MNDIEQKYRGQVKLTLNQCLDIGDFIAEQERRYQELRAVAEKMREALGHASYVGEIHFKTCVLSEQVSDEIAEALKSFEAFKAKEGE